MVQLSGRAGARQYDSASSESLLDAVNTKAEACASLDCRSICRVFQPIIIVFSIKLLS